MRPAPDLGSSRQALEEGSAMKPFALSWEDTRIFPLKYKTLASKTLLDCSNPHSKGDTTAQSSRQNNTGVGNSDNILTPSNC